MKLLIKNGHVVNPENDLNAVQDVLIENDRIIKVADSVRDDADTVLDAKGMYEIGRASCRERV